MTSKATTSPAVAGPSSPPIPAEKSYTWYQGTQRNLNDTKQARVDLDYYESDYGDYSTNGRRRRRSAHDQRSQAGRAADLPGCGSDRQERHRVLRLPAAPLHHPEQVRYFTFEASTDGGSTWTAIWNATELGNPGGIYLKGTAEVEVPEAYRTANVQFAFRLKSGSVYDDYDGMFAIDNVKLVSAPPTPAPAAIP